MTQPAVLRQRAISLHQEGRHAEARAAYAACLAEDPRDGGLWTNLGALLRSMGEVDLSLQAQERAFALDPQSAVVRNNLSNILNDLGYHGRALDLRLGLMAEQPDQPAHGALAAKALRGLGRCAEAVALLDGQIARFPDHAESRIQRALSALTAGDYARGFTDTAARWETGELTPRRMATPRWQGERLNGETVLVLPEQGHGDVVAFARFLPVLKARGAGQVLFVCEAPLLRLLADVEGADWIGPAAAVAAPYQLYADLMDLPRWYFAPPDGAGQTALPAPTRCTVPAESRNRAQTLLAPHRGRFKIGIVWSGSASYRGNAFRSVPHRQFHDWLDLPAVQMVSLYKGPELAAFTGDGSDAFILNFGAHDRDFADCAALMHEMDLVVTSCTATAHIAGSLGVKVWTLLHWEAFWMWGQGREDTPWYPAMRLWRQEIPRDWAEVFARLRPALEAEIAAWQDRAPAERALP